MAKKKQSAKSKELYRLRKQIKRMEKRGYRFSESFKTSLSNLSWQKLRTITTRKLYSLSTALSNVSGEIISGFKKRAEERREAGLKGAAKRKKKSETYVPRISDIVYQNILDLIDEYPGSGAGSLKRMIDWEIKTYGKEAVIKAMAEAPQELIKLAQEIVYYEEEKSVLHDAYIAFHNLITGVIMDEIENKRLEDFLSNDSQLSESYEN